MVITKTYEFSIEELVEILDKKIDKPLTAKDQRILLVKSNPKVDRNGDPYGDGQLEGIKIETIERVDR